MNRKQKARLQGVFAPPPSPRKKAFLDRLPCPKTSFADFFFSQAGFIRKRVWFLWGLCFVGLLLLLSNRRQEFLQLFWIVSALLPFTALLTTMELSRSSFCRMAELESTCRFHLQNVILVRASILGTVNLLMLTLAAVLLAHQPEAYSLLRLGLYLLTPYLLSCGGCLFTINRLQAPDCFYACGGICGSVSVCCILLSNSMSLQLIYGAGSIAGWGLVFLAALSITGVQAARFFQKTREPV